MSFADSGGCIDHSVTNTYRLVERVWYLFITVFWPLVPELGLQRSIDVNFGGGFGQMPMSETKKIPNGRVSIEPSPPSLNCRAIC